MGGDGHLLYHSEVWWISRERVMERVWNLLLVNSIILRLSVEFASCDRNVLCDLIDEKIIKLFSFAICFGLLD